MIFVIIIVEIGKILLNRNRRIKLRGLLESSTPFVIMQYRILQIFAIHLVRELSLQESLMLLSRLSRHLRLRYSKAITIQ